MNSLNNKDQQRNSADSSGGDSSGDDDEGNKEENHDEVIKIILILILTKIDICHNMCITYLKLKTIKVHLIIRFLIIIVFFYITYILLL